jgi:hypothetical protein
MVGIEQAQDFGVGLGPPAIFVHPHFEARRIFLEPLGEPDFRMDGVIVAHSSADEPDYDARTVSSENRARGNEKDRDPYGKGNAQKQTVLHDQIRLERIPVEL